MKNYYTILGVPQNATQLQIKEAFRKLSKRYHPDLNKGKDSEQIFIEVQEAYNALKDEKSRKAYDVKMGQRMGREKNNSDEQSEAGTMRDTQFNMANFEQNFEGFFGFNPKTKEMSEKRPSTKKNPIDTTDLFERFFNK